MSILFKLNRHLKYCRWIKIDLSHSITFNRKLSSQEIRQIFIDYYVKQHHHQYVHSSPVILPSDKSLLFVNSGMNQFKPLFLGQLSSDSPMLSYRRVVNYQKCIRVGGKHNDLDDVGNDLYHHTFFEMLGTWSFGDYSKEEACKMAWILLTDIYKLPKQQLYVTYFNGDQELELPPDAECYDVWKSIGVPDSHIIGSGAKDNFWDMGFTGPCGPCTEIHFDHVGNRLANGLVNAGDPLVTELWNLVFIQYNRLNGNNLEELPRMFIDCGMGFERIVAAVQGKTSNYDTDVFDSLIREAESLSNVKQYSGLSGVSDSDGIDAAYRKVVDHIRMLTIAISDGCRPNSINQGHILRRIIREAIDFSQHKLKMKEYSLSKLVPVVIDMLEPAYPEMKSNVENVINTLQNEEEKYHKLLHKSEATLNEMLKNLKVGSLFPGQDAWKLYSSHGYPLSTLNMVLIENGIRLDKDGFEKAKQVNQKSKDANHLKNRVQQNNIGIVDLLHSSNIPATNDDHKYDYRDFSLDYFGMMKSDVLSIIKNGAIVDYVEAGEECAVILDKTHFYAEEGGQVCDQGSISTDNFEMKLDFVKKFSDYVLHHGKITSGFLKVNDSVHLILDKEHRQKCMQNHTATHLLNYASRQVLNGTNQESSFVDAEFLRFSFQSERSLSNELMLKLQTLINKSIKDSIEVERKVIPYDVSLQLEDVITLPGEIYPDVVSLIKIGQISSELCCGTHVKNTSDLSRFLILSSKSVGQTVQSIKAVTGSKAAACVSNFNLLSERLSSLKANVESFDSNDAVVLIKKFSNELKIIKKETQALDLSFDMREELETMMQAIKVRLDSDYKLLVFPSLLISAKNELSSIYDNIYFLVYTLNVSANGQLLPNHLIKEFNHKPIMLFSESTDKHQFWCHCFVPKECITKDFDASSWVNSIKPSLKGSFKVFIKKSNYIVIRSSHRFKVDTNQLSNEFIKKNFIR